MNNAKVLKRVVLTTAICAVILNVAAMISLLLTHSEPDEVSAFVKWFIGIHSFLFAYLVYQFVSVAIKKSVGVKTPEPQSLIDYYKYIFKNFYQSMMSGLMSFIALSFLSAFSILVALFVSGFILMYVDVHQGWLIPALIYSLYIVGLLIFLGLYESKKITNESWRAVKIRYFGKMIVFFGVIVLFYLFSIK